MTDPSGYRPDQVLKDAAKHGELVVFVGAGASKLCGSPDWRGFADQVVGTLEKKGVLSFLEAEQLRGLGDARRTLSIAMALAKEHGIKIDFDGILHPAKPNDMGVELYELLSSLRPVFVTTNYDKWLDDTRPAEISAELKSGGESEPTEPPARRSKYYRREHLSSALLAERGAVIHLHGSYTDPDSMVVSLKDYIEHYADQRVQAFLAAMFKNYTVLFVGYGLAELEILDYIIRSNESLRTGPSEPRHFLLYAHRSTESVQTGFMEHFFRDQCGVGVIKYCIDAKGYPELLNVFKDWSSELDVRDPTTLDLQTHLDKLIAAPTPTNQEAALHLVNKHKELTSYFVNALKDLNWFHALDAAGYFSVEHSPGVKEVTQEKGVTYMAEGWPALRYLETIAPLMNIEQAKRALEIIRAVSADAQQRQLDNWRTWWSLATIMSQLPPELIEGTDIEMIRTWITGRFNLSMVGQQLGETLLPRLLESQEPENWKKALLLVDILSMVRNKEESK
jgi:hypothetical protein